MTLLQVEHVSRAFGSQTALQDISFSVSKGDSVGIIGRSGAGKSTLLRCLNGLERPQSGRILLEGEDLATLPEDRLVTLRRRIGVVFQHFNLLNARTVAANVALPLEIAGVAKEQRTRRVAELLELVGLADHARKYPALLSGGQKQRVGIARALAANPSLLLCDEATSALDPETTASILALLADINRTLGLTIVFITHEMDVVRQLAHHVLVLDKGRIVARGTPADILDAAEQTSEPALPAGFSTIHTPNAQTVLRLGLSTQDLVNQLLAQLAHQHQINATVLATQIRAQQSVPKLDVLVQIANPSEESLTFLKNASQSVEVVGYVPADS
ncbi:methionine ABC transporter ATP-binding protein [Acetobacter senegalensis]|uniref:methionine ABC transporter ATP-binding protein n=1 Tax=Acetobacter senegalensis TaxID=446692 RepID=UPI002656F711|nr:ATP-binding cassette domain-containing protein [Acetobacter senegalensis]MDN7353581.1 ATP-binding cassette domain-containing protein [Acetobacter senegalensis]